MNKKEISEVKKLLTPRHCCLDRICGCYVDAEKNQRLKMKEAFLSLPEEEMHKYFTIFRKVLSGTLDKHMLNLSFPLEQEAADGTQTFLLKLRDSELRDDELLDQFYARIMDDYIYGENYMILLVHGAYDVPGRASDNLDMDDASDYVYSFVLCAICPVNLSKPGLRYNAEANAIENAVQDWIVENPDNGFLFPAFNDRNSDIHNTLYYAKNPEILQRDLIDAFLGCPVPLSSKSQQEVFQALIEETLDTESSFDTVLQIHEQLNELVEAHSEEPEPLVLDKAETKKLFADSGVSNEALSGFDEVYDTLIPDKLPLSANNIARKKDVEIKAPDVTIRVAPERAQLIEQKMIGDIPYILIRADAEVEINGVPVKHMPSEE